MRSVSPKRSCGRNRSQPNSWLIRLTWILTRYTCVFFIPYLRWSDRTFAHIEIGKSMTAVRVPRRSGRNGRNSASPRVPLSARSGPLCKVRYTNCYLRGWFCALSKWIRLTQGRREFQFSIYRRFPPTEPFWSRLVQSESMFRPEYSAKSIQFQQVKVRTWTQLTSRMPYANRRSKFNNGLASMKW